MNATAWKALNCGSRFGSGRVMFGTGFVGTFGIPGTPMLGGFTGAAGIGGIAVVGFGTGITTGALAKYQETKSIDLIEISGTILQAAHYFDGNGKRVALYDAAVVA